MVKYNSFLVLSIALICLFGCRPDKPDKPDNNPVKSSDRKIWVANEGSLGNGNASLSIILPNKDSIYNNVYKNKNNQQLGDVFQSINIIDDHAFLAINNSDIIKIINKDSFTLMAEISVKKPRYMLQIDSQKLYVGSLFYPDITIINPQTFQVIGKIPTEHINTEGLFLHKEKVYACSWDTTCNFILEIDPASNQIIDKINIPGYAPQQILADKEGILWVLSGNVSGKKQSYLTQINPQNKEIIKSFAFDNNSDILKPAFNPTKDTLYFLSVDYNGNSDDNGVFRMSINANELPATPFIKAEELQYFWALGIDNSTGNIYVGDPKGFIQQGSILVYRPNGQLIQSYKTELGPGFFYFE